jgi:hypothetical protein
LFAQENLTIPLKTMPAMTVGTSFADKAIAVPIKENVQPEMKKPLLPKISDSPPARGRIKDTVILWPEMILLIALVTVSTSLRVAVESSQGIEK